MSRFPGSHPPRLRGTAARWATLLAIFPATACGARSAIAAGDGGPATLCQPPAVDVTSWTLIDRGPFSFRLPPDFAQEEAHPIDSWAEFFVAGRRSVSFDYGRYSGGEPRAPRPRGYAECTATIGGRPARIATWPERGGYTAWAQWRDVGRDSATGMPLHMMMHAWSPTAAGQREALAIFHSLRLK